MVINSLLIQKNEEGEQHLSVEPELSNIDMRDSIASELLQIDDQDKNIENLKSKNSDTLSFLGKSIKERRRDSKNYLVPKFPEITLNEGGNLKEESMPHIPSSFPTTPLHLEESKDDEDWKFLRDARSPRSGSPIGSPGSPTPSVYHDAVGYRDEFWKGTGGSVVGAGLGITLGQSHDASTKRYYQHDMLVRTQESNFKLQKGLEECHKKIMVAQQQTVENKRKSTESQLSKGQYYEEEIQRMKDEHVSELSAQKEALQKAIKIEIGLEKARLVQEFSSRLSQEVTKACKKQELRIKQLNRTIRDLRGEKQEQEMDMEAYRENIASQGEELVKANKRVQELVHNLAGRNQEVERLHAKIGGLEKRSIEAQSLAEQTVKELQKSKRELEARQTKEDYAQYSISDAETRSEQSDSSVPHYWNAGRRTAAEPKNWELELSMLSEKLAKGKAVIESQSCQINLQREEIVNLAKTHEECDATIKVQRRKIQSLEVLPKRLFALSESFDNLNDQFQNLNKAEEQGKATIKQLQNDIDEFEATRAELKEAHECLIAKETDLNEMMIKLQQHEAVMKQQKKEIDELMISKTKLEKVQADIDAKETYLNDTMIKLQQHEAVIKQQKKEIAELMITKTKLEELQECLYAMENKLNESMNKLEGKDSIINQQQREIDELMIKKTKLEEVQEYLDAKETELNESMNKLEHKESIINQQQKEMDKLLITGIKLKEIQECLDAKQIDSDEAIIKLERNNEAILKQQQKKIDKLLITGIKLKQVQESLDLMQAKYDETMIKQKHDEAIISQQRKEIDQLVLIRANLKKEAQESLDSKQTELNETMSRLERDNAIIMHQQGEIQELAIARKKLQGSLSAKHTHLEKTMIELEQANQELQILSGREQQQQVKANAKLNEEAFKYIPQARPVLADDHSVNSNRNASTTRSSYAADKHNPLPNVGESARPLLLANPINNNNHNNNSATLPPPRETRLFGAGDISEYENIEDDDGYYYDDGHESLQEILQMAVAGGAAILRKLEMIPIGL